MSVEFVDTSVLIYAHDRSAGVKYEASIALLTRLFESGSGAISTQVLVEFYGAATKILGMTSQEAEEVMADLGEWYIHRPAHKDLLEAARTQRRYSLSWWDALIVRSAAESGARVLWTEDLAHGQRLGPLTIRNPFL